MAQHDYDIANASFPTVRTDINNVLSAINTLNSGTSAPGSAVAGSLYLDTTSATTPTLKLYDGSDWISLCTFDYSANTVNWLDSTVSADLSGDSSPQLGGDLDTNSQNILIDDAHFIADESGNEQIIFQTTGSAVNQFDVTNAASGSDPTITATGDDSNVGLGIVAKGTGIVDIQSSMNSSLSSTGKALVMGF